MNNTTEFELYKERANFIATESVRQLGNLVLGNTMSKIGLTVGLMTNSHVSFVSEPGTGKSTLVLNADRLFDDITEEEVAKIPASSTMTDKMLFGSKVVLKNEVIETTGLIKEKTKLLLLSEGSRLSPFAVNPLNDLLLDKKFTKIGDDKELVMSNFRSAILAYNLTDNGDGIFTLSDAFRSRFSITCLGEELSTAESTLVRGGWQPEPDKIQHVMSTDMADSIANYAKEKIVIPDNVDKEMAEDERIARSYLDRKLYYREGPRLTNQLGKIARTLYLMNNGSWDEFELAQLNGRTLTVPQTALALVIPSRLAGGSYSKHNNLDVKLAEVLDEIRA